MAVGCLPVLGAAEGRLACLGGEVFVDLGELEGELVDWEHVGLSVLVVYGEGFAPVALAGEYGVAESVVDLDAANLMLGYEFLGCGYGLFDGQSVEVEATYGFAAWHGGVADYAFFGVEALLRDVGALDDGAYLEVEGFGEGVVTAVVGWDCHYGACAVAGEYVVADPDGDFLEGEGVYGVGAGEYACDFAVGDALTLGAFAGLGDVVLDGFFLLGGGEAWGVFAFGGEDHEGHAEDGVGACGEYGEDFVGVFDVEVHFRAFGASYPVALCLFEGVGPVDGVEAVEESLCVG